MLNSAHLTQDVESTYTATLRVETSPGVVECIRLKRGLSHADALAFAEAAADRSSLNVVEIAVILDRADHV